VRYALKIDVQESEHLGELDRIYISFTAHSRLIQGFNEQQQLGIYHLGIRLTVTSQMLENGAARCELLEAANRETTIANQKNDNSA
jgi:hypothetical protein